MAEGIFDPARIEYQREQLRRLGRRQRRVGLLRRAAQRRATGLADVEARAERELFHLTRTLDPGADPVLIVPRHVFVDRAQAETAVARLTALGGGEARTIREDVPGEAAIVEVPASVDMTTALRVLRAETIDDPEIEDGAIRASANHVAAHSGTSKGGSTPKNTDVIPASPRTPGDEVVDKPLVIVVDTGLAASALHKGDTNRTKLSRMFEDTRTDAWLDRVTVQTKEDIDLLDTEDYHGNHRADGFLDLGAGHGTFVTGVIRWHAPKANITVLRALDTDGYGSEDQVAMAIGRAAALFGRAGGPGLLNLSLGMETVDGDEPVGLVEALNALPEGVKVVAAAGNSATGKRLWPAACPGVVAVGSVERTPTGLTPSDWSNYGEWVDFSALGEGVISTYVAGTETEGSGADDDPFDPDPDTFVGPNAYALWTGTSFATAKVTGELAAYIIANQGASVDEAVAALEKRGARIAGYGVALDV